MVGVSNFISNPKIGEESKPDHGLRVGNAGFEVEHFGNPTSQPNQESPKPNSKFGVQHRKGVGLLSEQAAKQPNRQEDQRSAQRAKIVPGQRMPMGCRSDRAGSKNDGKENLPADSLTNYTKKWISSVIDFFAGEAPKRRFPKDGVLAQKRELLSIETIDAESASNRNQNARVTAKIVTTDSQLFVSAEGEVNAKAGDHKKDDHRRRAEYDALPRVGDEPSKRGGYVDAGEEWKDSIVAHGDPEG